MIPVPYDRPLLQPVLYSLETFPSAINTTYMALLPGAERIMNKVIVAVANEISSTAIQTNIRMFAYNMLSSNNWNNKFFQEACQFTANYITLAFTRGQNKDSDAIVKESVAMLCCVIASTVPGFFSMLDQVNQARVQKNTSIYKEINTNILTAMNHSTLGGGMSNMMGMNNNMMAGMVNPAVNGLIGNMASPQNNQTIHTRYGPINQKPVDETPAVVQNPPTQQQTVVIQQNIKLITSDIGSVSMDQAAHSVVYSATQGSGVELAAQRVQEAIQAQSDKLDKSTEGSVFMDEDIHDSNSLEVILQMLQSDYITEATKSVRIHHASARILKPIFSAVSVELLFDALYRCNTFERVAEILKKHYMDGLTAENTRCVLSTVSIMDRCLTDQVNVFLKSLSPTRKLSITSFIEDIESLPSYIRSKLGISAFEAYSRFHARAMQTYFKERKNELAAPSYYVDGEKDYGYFTTSYGISFLTASLIECGVSAFSETAEILQVTRQSTPLLFKMLSEASALVQSGGVINHIFMTLDGLQYTVEHPVYDNNTLILVRA